MRIVPVLAAATLALSAWPAAAAVTQIVLTGVASGGDNGHLMAPAPFGTLQLGVDLATGATTGVVTNRAFTLTLRVDDSLGLIDTFPEGDSIYGHDAESPMTATFSMGGFTYDFGNTFSMLAKAFLSPDQIYGGANESRPRPPMTGDFTVVSGAVDFNIISATDIFQERRFGEPSTWIRGPGDLAEGHLSLSLQDTSGTPAVYVLGPVRTADLTLRIDSLKITAVPEPTTWGMMILGFGAIGAAVRRRAIAA